MERGELESYLIEITAEVLRQKDAETGRPLVDVIVDQAGSKGTGVWTVQNPSGSASPSPASPRPSSRARCRASPSSGPPCGAPFRPPGAGAAADGFEDDVRAALYASKIVAYAQGFDAIVAGAEEYGWDIDKGEIARIWRGGCIIRAQFLNRIVEAYATTPASSTLLDGAVLRRRRRRRRGRVARVVVVAAPSGIPAPAFSSALAYYDALASERLPAALIQGQRDFFGAHTYRRVDRDGTFHTLWSGDRSEIATSRRPTRGTWRYRTWGCRRGERRT